jgi:hypothetical protein
MKTTHIVLLLIILTGIFFYQPLTNPDELLYSPGSDIVFYHYNLQRMKHNTFQDSGELLKWNPLYTIGISAVNDPESFLFYPPFLLSYIMQPAFVFTFVVMLHIFLAGLFTYLYTRKIGLQQFPALISAIIFMFSGKIMSHLFAGHIVFTGIAYTPLLLLLIEEYLEKKKLIYPILFSGILALQIISSHPQLLLYSTFIVGIYWLVRTLQENKKPNLALKPSLIMLAAVIFSLTLAAFYILPTGEGASLSSRASPTYEYLSQFSLPPTHLITLLSPHFFGTPTTHTYWGALNFWELSIFLGILPLLLALIGLSQKNKYRWLFSGIAILTILIALGKFTPLYHLITQIPGFHLFRAPARILFLFTLAASVLAGFGIQKILSQKNEKLLKILTIISILAIISTIGASLLTPTLTNYGQNLVQDKIDAGILKTTGPFSRSASYYLENVSTVLQQILKDMLLATIVLVAFTTTLFAFQHKKATKQTFLTIVAIIIIAELFIYGMPFIDAKPIDEIYSQDNIITALQTNPTARSYDPTYQYPAWKAQFYDLDMVDSGANSVSAEYVRYIEEADHHPILLDLLNVGFIINNENNEFTVESRETLPKAFLVPNAKPSTNPLGLITSDIFNPKTSIILSEKPTTPLNNPGEYTPAVIEQSSPNHFKIKINNENPGYLFVSEQFHPGWKATTNNQPLQILRANSIFRAVYIEAGTNEITFSYQPQVFKRGIIISIISMFILIASILYFRKN